MATENMSKSKNQLQAALALLADAKCPCTKCETKKQCGVEHLACSDFAHYVHDGTLPRRRHREPSAEIYIVIFHKNKKQAVIHQDKPKKRRIRKCAMPRKTA